VRKNAQDRKKEIWKDIKDNIGTFIFVGIFSSFTVGVIYSDGGSFSTILRGIQDGWLVLTVLILIGFFIRFLIRGWVSFER
jgi:hypothetical protein